MSQIPVPGNGAEVDRKISSIDNALMDALVERMEKLEKVISQMHTKLAEIHEKVCNNGN